MQTCGGCGMRLEVAEVARAISARAKERTRERLRDRLAKVEAQIEQLLAARAAQLAVVPRTSSSETISVIVLCCHGAFIGCWVMAHPVGALIGGGLVALGLCIVASRARRSWREHVNRQYLGPLTRLREEEDRLRLAVKRLGEELERLAREA